MKRKTAFELPYVGIERFAGFDLLYGLNGEFSVVLEIQNPVVQYAASPGAYDEFHSLFLNIVKILGDGYVLQKLDVLSRQDYPLKTGASYLQDKYNRHFAGRKYLKASTFITITKQVKKGRFYVYDKRSLVSFQTHTNKVLDVLAAAGCAPVVLDERSVNLLTRRILSMDFSGRQLSLDNFLPDETGIKIGDRYLRSIALVNTDNIDLPPEVMTYGELNDKDSMRGFPVDLLSFLTRVPDCDTIIYNQVIDIPAQQKLLNQLVVKRKRHSGIPDPANNLCVNDIDLLLNDVARDGQLLVNVHYNILVCSTPELVQKAANFIESSLFQLGIIPSKNAYNQLELFRCALPGNGVELKPYDLFLTTCDAALCLFYKERLPVDEQSDFLISFTDRQGIPIAIDPADLPMRTGRINNRNKFVLGPSGSGKSFFMNALVEQYLRYNMDVVIIDVGHSYSGLCGFYNGKYITYTDKDPITMNPFAISEEEYNIEKKDFLVTLIGLLWKGADGELNTVERDVISEAVSWYYAAYFDGQFGLEKKLSFDTFYEFALEHIPAIKEKEQIPFDLHEFRYVLKKFSKGGQYQSILNEAADESLFSERFIVYEIDNVQNNKVLFPIVTLIIMDVFIQKMRHRKDRRKAIILEEAWKALTSPIMAGFLLYLNKTVRKFYGEIIEVTQELSDIISNPLVKDSIINNSDTVILLDQSKFRESYNEIAALLSISEVERRKIFTINQLDNKQDRGRFKEVYIRRGSEGEVYGVEVALEQYLAYTTEKPEKSAVAVYVGHYDSYPDALDAFVADMKASGLALGAFVAKVNAFGQVMSSPC